MPVIRRNGEPEDSGYGCEPDAVRWLKKLGRPEPVTVTTAHWDTRLDRCVGHRRRDRPRDHRTSSWHRRPCSRSGSGSTSARSITTAWHSTPVGNGDCSATSAAAPTASEPSCTPPAQPVLTSLAPSVLTESVANVAEDYVSDSDYSASAPALTDDQLSAVAWPTTVMNTPSTVPPSPAIVPSQAPDERCAWRPPAHRQGRSSGGPASEPTRDDGDAPCPEAASRTSSPATFTG